MRRSLLAWAAAALAAALFLLGVLAWQHKYGRTRWSNFLVGDPHRGRHVFQDKGCADCHAVNGAGGRLAPDLGFELSPQARLEELVTAMWNHAPRMREGMRLEGLRYPTLSYQEMSHLFAYLYTARYVDEPGDVYRGRQLFDSKGCRRCHAVSGRGGKRGPDLASLSGLGTPIAWTQTMWNHASAMEEEMSRQGLDWPQFAGNEMNDLLAYLRQVSGGARPEFALLPADPDRGWELLQRKGCIVCHAVKGEGGQVGPELGPERELPLTIIQFAGLMWNHSPGMERAMKSRRLPRPIFSGREMADLIAFLHSLRYFEPGGSPQTGQLLFTRRDCSRCHGIRGEGTPDGPALRGRGRTYTCVTLAAELWAHGPKMQERMQAEGLPWPRLAETDIGHLLAFLNRAPMEGDREALSVPPPDDAAR